MTEVLARPKRRRWQPVLVGAALGGLWFIAFHWRVHAGSALGPGPILEGHPGLLQRSAPAFLIAFTVGSAVVWMPCILQMVLVFAGVRSGSSGGFRGRAFFAGYLGAYAALGLAAAALGEAFGRLPVLGALQVVGAVAIAVIGLHLLGVVSSRWLRACGSALGFAVERGRVHRLGRVSTGVAFAAYCAGCCGPLLYPLFVFAVLSGSLVVGSATALGFAVAMAAPIAILAALGRRSLRVVRPVADNYALVSVVSGAALLAFGALLLVNQPLIWLVETTHEVLG